MKRRRKKAKKKVAFPRRRWHINPATRVKESAKLFSRSKAKKGLREQVDEG